MHITTRTNLFVLTTAVFLNIGTLVTSQMTDDESTNGDAGLNRHEELVLIACLGATCVMSITIVLFLWYVVHRTKTKIRYFKAHLPYVIDKLRREIADLEETDNGRIIVAGTLPVSGEFEGVHPLDARGRVRLTSYTRRQDVGSSTDFGDNQTAAIIEHEDDTDEESDRQLTIRDAEDSKDFIFVNGEYFPKDSDGVGKSPPSYVYDNLAYDNPYTENDEENNIVGKKGKKGKHNGKAKGKDKTKFSVYESHV